MKLKVTTTASIEALKLVIDAIQIGLEGCEPIESDGEQIINDADDILASLRREVEHTEYLLTKGTIIAEVELIDFYEHPDYGDEVSLMMHDTVTGQFLETTPFYDVPCRDELEDFDGWND